MANSPAAQPGGTYRVIRVRGTVEEAVVTAASVTAAKAAARVLPAVSWTRRVVNQTDPSQQDIFEYDVVSSDDGA